MITVLLIIAVSVELLIIRFLYDEKTTGNRLQKKEKN